MLCGKVSQITVTCSKKELKVIEKAATQINKRNIRLTNNRPGRYIAAKLNFPKVSVVKIFIHCHKVLFKNYFYLH